MPVCLALAQAVVAVLPTDAFTLLWTHSVERTEWREEWRIDDGRLRVVAATVAGSGAGMEPPPGAVLVDNAWHYVPAVPPMTRLRLANSQSGGELPALLGRSLSAAGEPPAGFLRGADRALSLRCRERIVFATRRTLDRAKIALPV